MLYYEELFTRSQCCNCQQEIPGLGIECAECHGGSNFRFCTECFSTLVEIGQHKPEHRYRFFDSGSLSLFPSSANEVSSTKENEGSSQSQKWSAREDIRLLDAIEQYGFGNWCDISKHIETKSSSETKKEFVERFIQGNVGICTWDDKNNGEDNNEFRRTMGLFPKPIDHTLPCDEGPLSPSLTQRLPPLDISSDEMIQLGYMPFRDDYEKEYDNEAEKLVAQLAFTSEDDETDVGLKLALVDMYASRLRERARRKKIIRDYQLVSKFFKKDRAKASGTNGDSNGASSTKDSSKKFQNYGKNLQEKLRPFAHFHSSREFEHLTQNLVKEKELRLRLTELYKYRTNGITKADECVEFERSKAGIGLRGKRNAGSAFLETLGEEEDNDEDRSYKKAMIQSPALIHQLHPSNQILMQGSPSPKMSLQVISSVGNVGSTSYASQNLTPLQFYREDSNLKNLESNGSELALLPQLLLEPEVDGGVGMDQLQMCQDPLEAPNSFQQNEKQKGWEGLYTANFVPGSELLTQEEFKLCLKVKLLPAQFLSIKLAHIIGRLEPKSDGGDTENPTTTMDENNLEAPPEIDRKEWEQILSFLSSSDRAVKFSTNYNNNSVSQSSVLKSN